MSSFVVQDARETSSRQFHPHPLVRGGHAQTLAGLYWPSRSAPDRARRHWIQLDDGDHIVLHENLPPEGVPIQSAALLLHGLAGCHASGYMRRLAWKLRQRGVRVFRMDMRGVGAAAGWARQPMHAGRVEDVRAAIEQIGRLCPADLPLALVGFSLGGNLALVTLAAASRGTAGPLQRGVAIAPPVDLATCSRQLHRGVKRIYDAYLVRHVLRSWRATGGTVPRPAPRTIYQFDQRITAPKSGFRDAEEYYAAASSGPRLADIRIPTRILAAADDPIVPIATIRDCRRSSAVVLTTTASGGHLGYLTSRRHAPDRRWLDQQVLNWVCEPATSGRWVVPGKVFS
jgi:predicted alpha/beta-fold hydrolase